MFTAHPTQAQRRTLLQKHSRIAAALEGLDRPDRTPQERRALHGTLTREVAACWLTDELKRRKPTPVDEALSAFVVVEQVLWDALPAYLRELDAALVDHTGQGLPADRAPVRLGSWMGGDRDGNPFVTCAVTREVYWLARCSAADRFHREVVALREALSVQVCTDELRQRVGDAREPYRALLTEVLTEAEIKAITARTRLAIMPYLDQEHILQASRKDGRVRGGYTREFILNLIQEREAKLLKQRRAFLQDLR